jgi:1-aminocyclopropane-1-carboxylate deaminase
MLNFFVNDLSYQKTPIQEIVLPRSSSKLFVKREDLNHPFVSGNKWWKLKYNLLEAQRKGHDSLLTFGGAYSNHIFATAAAAHEIGLKTIGIIRGEEILPLNHTLSFAKSKGMQLHYVSREAYRNKTEKEFTERLKDKFGDFYLIPEGGTNDLAIKGCAEFATQLSAEIEFDYLCLPIGTGGTIAGMINVLDVSKKIIGFPVLKGAQFLENKIATYLTSPKQNWSMNYDYHFGGYAKQTEELAAFIQSMNERYKLPLDRIYTGKMFCGVLDLIQKGFFKKGSTILVLHTGGLQKR